MMMSAPATDDEPEQAPPCEPSQAEIDTAKKSDLLVGVFFGLMVGAIIGVVTQRSS